MDKNETSELIAALQKGTVTVTFQKVNSEEIRVMPCTLNKKVLEANKISPTIGSVSSDSSQIPVWSLDKNAWRSFIADTVLGWEVLGE
jgi:hypothetical protein